MTDLAEIGLEWLPRYCKKSRDFEPLIEHLRSGGEVTDDMKALLADVLSGEIKPSRKKKTRMDALSSPTRRAMLKFEIEMWADEIRFHADISNSSQNGHSPLCENWDQLKEILSLSGYSGDPETKGEFTKAAKQIVCRLNQLTPSQLDVLLIPRPSRPRKSQVY